MYKKEHSSKTGVVTNVYVPMTEMLALLFDIPELKVSEQRTEIVANNTYVNQINPVLDVVALMTGTEKLKVNIVNRATALAKQYDAAVKYIEERKLDEWVHRKAIQKAVESFRVTDEHKEYLKTFR